MDAFPKEGSGYPIRDFASLPGTEQTFLLPQARSILTSRLPEIKPGAWLNTKQLRGPRQIGIQYAPGETRVCAPPLVEPQVQCRPSASHFEPLGGSLSTSHPQIPPSQQLGLHSPPRTPGRPLHIWHLRVLTIQQKMGISDLVALKLFLSETFCSSKFLVYYFGTKWSNKILISNNNIQIISLNIFDMILPIIKLIFVIDFSTNRRA